METVESPKNHKNEIMVAINEPLPLLHSSRKKKKSDHYFEAGSSLCGGGIKTADFGAADSALNSIAQFT